ncbi:MAG TPA: LamG-like jellyroll fold domain-containing protein, partial [Longimicrobiales bacterium]|nr:LamG-like jellyroll fold domain-containing protein [Longimicrobiales bacterium]
LTTSAQDTNGYAISAPDVTWTSLGPDMATVDASGLVTAVDGGTATLKVESAGAMDSSVVSVREYALDFDGTGAYGVAATGLDLGMDSTWTVELWVRRDSAAGDQYLLDRSDAVGASNFQYALLLHDGAPAFAARTGGGPGDWYQATAPDTLPIGTWHHLAATYDSATAALTLYVDGAAVTPTLTNPGKFGRMRAGKGSAVYLGAYGTSAGDGNFQGALDEVRIWSVARTGSQTANDYLKRLAGTQPGLAAYWPLDVGAGTAATDLTGAHPATLNGTTWTIDAPDLHY